MISLWRSPFKQNNILQVGKLFLLHSLHLHTSNWQLWRWSQWWDAVTSPHLVPISPAMVKLLLDRNIATSLCHPQWQKPCWCLYLEPCTQLTGERIFMQWLTNLLWSAGSRNLLVTGGVPFFFFFFFYCSWLLDVSYTHRHGISFAVYCSNIWNDLSFSFHCCSLFVIPHNYSQPAPNARLPSPAQAPASHHCSTTWLAASPT